MNRKKKILLSALVLGAIAAVAGATFATFTAQTTNPGNRIAAGTLVLGNTPASTGTECLSTNGGTTNSNVNNCAQLINLSVKKPGDSGQADVKLQNKGSLAGTVFNVFMPSCTAGDASGESYHGTGDPCTVVMLTIAEYTDNTYATLASCVYGTGAACDFDATKTLSTFTATYFSSATGKGLSSLAAGGSRYYRVAVKLPDTADNTHQGRSATFDLSWFLQQ